MIPRTRRAVEGPGASSAALGALPDDAIKDLIADALAEVQLYTGGIFAKQLVVLARDNIYGAPTEYGTTEELAIPEQTVIISQAALNYFFFHFVNVKTHETIQDEAQSWDYDLSPTLLRDQMKYLVDQRDKALATISEEMTVDAYESFLHVRDIQTSQFIEPFIQVGGVDQVLTGQDMRFGEW